MFFKKEDVSVCDADSSDDHQRLIDALWRSQAMVEFSPDGEILVANEDFLKVVGYRTEEIAGRHHRMFVGPDYANSPDYQKFWDDIRLGASFAGEFERFNKKGESVWISASYTPVRDDRGQIIKIIKIATDITETKSQSIIQLGILEALSVSQAMIEFDTGGTVITANDNFLATLGYSLAEIRGQHHRIFCDKSFVASPDYTRFWSRLSSGEPVAGRFRRKTKDGRTIWIQASYNPVLGRDGKPCKVVKIASDITAEMEAELAAKDEAQNVGAAIAISTEQLSTTINEISESVARTASLANDATSSTRRSSEVADALQKSSEDIGKVINVIQDLADQTNLLALNATIEAARAGEQGRGFAVVANEVKELAKATSNETQNIEVTVSDIQSKISEMLEAVSAIQSGVDEVSSNTNTVASAIEEQSITMSSLSETANGLAKIADRD